MRTRGDIDHFRTVMDVRKMIEKENSRVNTLGFLALVSKGVEKFDQEWHKLVKIGLPPCWDPQSGALLPLTAYDQKMSEIMCNADISLEKTARLKAKTIIVALRKEFFLLYHLKKFLVICVDYIELTNM